MVEPNEEELFRLLAAFGPERAKQLAGDPNAVVFDEIAELAQSFANGKETLGAKPEGGCTTTCSEHPARWRSWCRWSCAR